MKHWEYGWVGHHVRHFRLLTKGFFKSRDWHKITHQLLSHLPLMFSRHIKLNTFLVFATYSHNPYISEAFDQLHVFPIIVCETRYVRPPHSPHPTIDWCSQRTHGTPKHPQGSRTPLLGATVCFCGIDWTAAWFHCFDIICVG